MEEGITKGRLRVQPLWLRLAISLGVLGIAVWALAPIGAADLDMFHEMGLFRELLRTGAVPQVDVFAYTPTVSPVVHHEWATGGVLYLVAVASGWGEVGIYMLWYLLVAGTAGLAYAAARWRGASGASAFALAGAGFALLSPGLAAVRAQMFTFLFVALLMLLLELDRRGQRWWLALWLPAYTVWLNLHGGFVVGVGLFGLHALESGARVWRSSGELRSALRSVRHLVAGGVAMFALVVVNPYGWDYVPYVWHALRLDRPLIAEWAPLWDPRAHVALPITFLLSLVVLAYAVIRRQGTERFFGLPLVVATAFLAAQHQRMVPIYGIIWFCCVAAYLARTPLARDLDRLWRANPAALAIAALVLGGFGVWQAALLTAANVFIPTEQRAGGPVYPVGATDYLAAQGFAGNLMTHFDDGAFVSWKLYPAVRVSLDSRYEVAYSPALVQQHDDFYAGRPGWEEMLDRFPTDAVLVRRSEPVNWLLEHRATAGMPEWERIYRDDAYAVFMRRALARRFDAVDRLGEPVEGRFP